MGDEAGEDIGKADKKCIDGVFPECSSRVEEDAV